MKRATKLALALGCAGLALAALEYRYVHYAHAWCHPARKPITRADRDDARRRLPGLEEAEFTTDDGIVIRGWYMPSQNGAVVVMGHGLGENRLRFLPDAEMLARHGYGCLFFDWRAHGESGGDTATWGDREQRDFSAAVGFAAARPDVTGGRIAGAGFSVGASAVAMEAAGDLRVRAVILLAVWPSLDEELRYKMRRYGPLSQWPLLYGFRREGVDFDDVRPIDAIARIAPRPILLVGGSADSDTPPWVMDRMVAAAGDPKARFTAQGAEHGYFRAVDPEAYDAAIVAFLDAALAPSRP